MQFFVLNVRFLTKRTWVLGETCIKNGERNLYKVNDVVKKGPGRNGQRVLSGEWHSPEMDERLP